MLAPSYTSDLVLVEADVSLIGKNGTYDRLPDPNATYSLFSDPQTGETYGYTGSDGNYINGLVVRSVDVVDPNGAPIEGVTDLTGYTQVSGILYTGEGGLGDDQLTLEVGLDSFDSGMTFTALDTETVVITVTDVADDLLR